MSTAASLAAAKKRRGPQQNNQLNKNMPTVENNKLGDFKEEYLTNIQILRRHEMRLFNLEKLYTNISEDGVFHKTSEYATKNDLELLLLEKNINGNNSKYDNILESNKSEISTLKNNIVSLQKTVTEMNSLIQNLKATVINQDSEIATLKKNE